MKVWKSVVALACACGFIGTGAACDKDNVEKKVKNMTPTSQIVEVSDVFEGAKSFKVSVDFLMDHSSSSIYTSMDSSSIRYNSTDKIDAHMDLWLSRTEDFVDAKLLVNAKNEYSYGYDDWSRSRTINGAAYLIGGKAYAIEEEDGKMFGEAYGSIYDLLAEELEVNSVAVRSMLSAALSEAQKIGVPEDILKDFLEAGNPTQSHTDTSISYVYNYKQLCDNIFELMKSVDDDTTLETLIDNALKMLGVDLTCEKVLSEVEKMGDKTLSEIKTEIEKEFGFKTEEVLELLQRDEIVALLNQIEPNLGDRIKSIDLLALTSQFGNETLDWVVENVSESYLKSAKDLVTYLRKNLKTPVLEMGFDDVLATVDNIKLDAAETGVTTTYNDKNELVSVSSGEKLDFYIGNTNYSESLKLETSFTFSEISASSITISLPDGIQFYS